MLFNNKKDIHQQALNWEASTAIALHQSEVRAWNITKIMTLLAVLAITGLVFMPVSYTHLDVYKRQGVFCARQS